MTEEMINARISEIADEYSLLPQLENYDLILEAVGDEGDIKATLKRGDITFEKTFAPTDDLSAIRRTFSYSEYISPHSCNIALERLEMAYFNEFGRLVVERTDSQEVFKVRPHQREKITELLQERLGDKLKIMRKVTLFDDFPITKRVEHPDN